MLKFNEPTGAAFTSRGRIITPANPSYTKNRSGHPAMIKAQESAEPFVTFDDSTSHSKTTAVTVASNFGPYRVNFIPPGFPWSLQSVRTLRSPI